MEYAQLKSLCIELEHFITPQWAVDAILQKEIMTHQVFDPCCGTGVLAESARNIGHDVTAIDVHDWGYAPMERPQDYLKAIQFMGKGDFTVLMNPPFSKACEFVEKSFELGARKIIMFQRWSFLGSISRRPFFEKFPMARQYMCGDRADCWRYDLPVNDKGRRYNPENNDKEMGSTPTDHGWFVWERGQEQSNPPTFKLYKNP